MRACVCVCLVLGECPTSLCDQTISLIVSVKEKLPLKVTFYLFHDSPLCFLTSTDEQWGKVLDHVTTRGVSKLGE